MRLLIDGDLNAFRNLELDGMRFAQGEGDGFAFELGAIADTNDVEFLFKALSNTVNGIGDMPMTTLAREAFAAQIAETPGSVRVTVQVVRAALGAKRVRRLDGDGIARLQ